MKQLYLIVIICSILSCGCAIYEQDSALEDISMKQLSSDLSVLAIERGENLIRKIVDDAFSNIHYSVAYCSDGSQIIGLSIDSNISYIRYQPSRCSNGSYQFFQTFRPAEEVKYDENGVLEIPFCINDSNDFRWILKDNEILFLDEEDLLFSQEYAALDYYERIDYRSAFLLDEHLPITEQVDFLKACVYNGNMMVLEPLLQLIPETDQENRALLELALSYQSNHFYLESNLYQPEIFYGESCAFFPSEQVLHLVAQSLQTTKSIEVLGGEIVTGNLEWQEVERIVNLSGDGTYVESYQNTISIHKLDLNTDGLMEILIFSPGGSMGNAFWEILFLDEDERIFKTINGDGMLSMNLYHLNQEYFFVSQLFDFNDKEFSGWQVYMLNQQNEIVEAQVYYEKTGSKIIFNDQHISIDDNYYLDWYLDNYIDQYKDYSSQRIGNKITVTDEIAQLFQELSNNRANYAGEYGIFDVNNDGIDDLTRVYMFFPSNQMSYYCDYRFIDSKTQQLIDLGSYFERQNFNLRRISPYQINDKNYFICLGGGYGNYTAKLIEINGLEPVELHSWFISVTNRVTVQVR